MSETVAKKRYANCAKYMPPARICSGCGAIIKRGDESYPDNHWPWCEGGEAVALTPGLRR